MKTLIAVIATMLASLMLTSCFPRDIGSCQDKDHCTADCVANTPCGKILRSRCEDTCSRCSFNEPECEQCWECKERPTR